MNVQTFQLEDVASVFNGKTPGKTDQRQSGHPVLKIKDVDAFGQFAGRFDSFVDSEFAAGLDKKMVRAGDTLVLNAAHNAAYVASKSFYASGAAVGALATGEWLILRPNARKVDARFIYYWTQLSETKARLGNIVKGIHLYPSDVAELPISLPSISDQKRVAGFLGQADRLRRTRRYALELGDNFLPAAFLRLFGDPKSNPKQWPTALLSDLCVKFSDGPFGSNLKSDHYTSSGVRVIRLQNIGIGDFVDDDQAFIAQSHFDELRKHECVAGDILIGTLGDPNLRACIQPPKIQVALNKADCIQAKPDPEKVDRHWLCWLLNIPSTLHLTPGLVHGQTRARISMGQLATVPVPVPPLALQKRFALIVERHERLRATQREALRQAEHLFQTLLHRAFTNGL